MANLNDDYWNTSLKSKFNFDEEDPYTSQLEIDYVANDVFSSKKEDINIFAIELVISKHCLDLLLADVENQNISAVPPVEDVIKNMVNGQRFFLGIYKSYKDKLLLLDESLKTCNGNIILRVADFLRTTLKFDIFCNVLKERKVALIQYANFLKTQGNIEELKNLYEKTGFTSNIRDLFFIKKFETNNQETLSRLKYFISSQSQYFYNDNERKILMDYVKFLEWQIVMEEHSSSIVQQLAIICEKQWKGSTSDDEVNKFKILFKITDIQFEWTVINCLAFMGLWKKLIEMFIKQNWLTKKHTLKTSISHENFIWGVARHNPPKNVLEQFLSCLNDPEKSVALAEKFNCHKFLIEYYISQRDRTGLMSCMEKVTLNSEEYYLITKALEAQDKKWKN